MTTTRRPLVRLVCERGHSHWAEPRLRILPDGAFALGIDCAFGGVAMVHYIGPRGWQTTPHAFASVAAAEAMRDELAAREQQQQIGE